MVRIASGLTAAAVVVWLAAPALAETETVKGELVDQTCYMKDRKNVGASHRECAETCAKKGQPLAVVTGDGRIYEVTGPLSAGNNAKLVPHLAHTVEITGDVSEKDGQMTIAAGAGSLKMVSRQLIDQRSNPWGVTVQSVEMRDVVIPDALQDAMSREAQAAREKQARIILGQAELEIAHSFEQAAKSYRDNPTALHLRAMNMLYEGLKEKGALMLIPSSAVESMGMGGLLGAAAMRQERLAGGENK